MYETVVLKKVYPLHHSASLYPLLLRFHLKVTYRKERNLIIGVDKLVGKVLINLLCHTKSVAYINIIIDVPAVAYAHS